MLIRCMIDNEVHHQFHASIFQAGNELINVSERAVLGVHVFVVRNVVSWNRQHRLETSVNAAYPYRPGDSCTWAKSIQCRHQDPSDSPVWT